MEKYGSQETSPFPPVFEFQSNIGSLTLFNLNLNNLNLKLISSFK